MARGSDRGTQRGAFGLKRGVVFLDAHVESEGDVLDYSCCLCLDVFSVYVRKVKSTFRNMCRYERSHEQLEHKLTGNLFSYLWPVRIGTQISSDDPTSATDVLDLTTGVSLVEAFEEVRTDASWRQHWSESSRTVPFFSRRVLDQRLILDDVDGMTLSLGVPAEPRYEKIVTGSNVHICPR